ncbi:MAG: MBL fold metallo-hydrolase [Anaerovoracaceae bacterium]
MKIKRYVGGSLESNGYIISNRSKGSCYIIDPGYEPKKFIDYIEDEGLKLLGIILTHHHYDHVGGASRIRDYFVVPVMMHEKDAFVYKGTVDRQFSDGDVLNLDGETLQIFNTPGHTRGSICILSEKSKVVFTGDTIFDTDLGRTDLEDGSPDEMKESCRNVIDRWSNEYTIYPGHDGSATMKQVRKYNQEFLECLK